MKTYRRILALLMIWTLLLLFAVCAKATETNNWWQETWNAVKPIASATNYSFSPYATYAPHSPKKWGGGILAVYNVNNYVGVGAGVDYLGQFSLVSANVQLKMDIHPLAFIGATNFISTPFVLAGVGTPFSGTSTAPTAIAISDAGMNLSIADIYKGWILGVAGAYGRWDNAGPYTGERYHGAITLRHGF